MRQITIDCASLESPRALHDALAEKLQFPQWYGGNLDALHDCLTAICEQTHLTLLRLSALGRYEKGFRRVLQDAAEENPNLQVTIL